MDHHARGNREGPKFIPMKTILIPFLLVSFLPVVQSQPAPPPPAPPAAPAPAAEPEIKWSDIKDLGYDDRAKVMDGLRRLRENLDRKIAALKARRSQFTANDNPGDFNAALKALETARTRLTSSISELGEATPQNWSQRHERVADAWENVENAYQKAGDEAP